MATAVKSPLLPLESIRSIAARYGYSEVQFNEQSRVVAFQSMDGKVRTNVYYTTGTVATCLSHPFKGKTQLFRRHQSLTSLEEIFENPRQHTGVGYYKTNVTNGGGGHRTRWTTTGEGKRKKINNKDYCDDAQRWRYVQATTNFCTAQQMAQIATICELWNRIRFDRGGPTEMELYNSMEEGVKQQLPSPCPENCGNCGHERSGTWCALATILIDAAQITERKRAGEIADQNNYSIDFMFPSMEFLTNSNNIPKEDLPPINCNQFRECQCHEGENVKRSLAGELQRFKRQLMSFPKQIRRELIYFFMKKIIHHYDLMVTSTNPTNCLFTFTHGGHEFHVTYYGGRFLSNEILSAHHDYGELVYGEETTGGRCNCHGPVH